MKYASVIIPVALEGTFTYSIPDEITDEIKSGQAVIVNFGKNKLYTAVVRKIHNNKPENISVKPILSVSKQLVSEIDLKLWEWIASYYCCTLGEVMKAAIPAVLNPNSQTCFLKSENNFPEFNELTENQLITYNALSSKKAISIQEISKYTGHKNPMPLLQALQEKGYITTEQNFKRQYKALYKKFILLNLVSEDELHSALDSLKRASAQKEFLSCIIDEADGNYSDFEADLSEFLKKTNTSTQVANSLEKKGIIRIESREIGRFDDNAKAGKLKTLSEEQTRCKSEIKNHFKTNDVVLLQGVSSSGKTEIYFSLINEVLNQGKTALFLLPEIAITTQILNRIRDAFGSIVGVYHSKYSDDERAEVWQKVANGTYKLVLGVRSAVFLPFQNLGLIVVDEEHETTYKQQDPAPRYHARDVSIVLAKMHNAKLILGTATPSLETYYNSINNKYARVVLNNRYGNVEMPEIVVADTLDAYKRKIMQLHFHPLLIDEIRNALAKKEQVILFRNRRGYSPYTECSECGHVIKCEFCNVSLTYHKNRKSLLCHYCGNAVQPITQCPECGSNKLISKGYGTEQIEEEIAHFFPNARISRLDIDTSTSRKNYERIISEFENKESDILIGTQMISKGLDFDNVSIVGILNADSMLNFPDFRAFERSFQLMVQVSGRAGRRDKRGKVIIQTTMPEHDIIRDIVDANYEAMAEKQLEERTYFRYPPVFRFIQIKLSHTDKETLWEAGKFMANKLVNILPGRIMGPEEPLVNKIQNRFILHISLRFENSIPSNKVKESIKEIVNETENNSDFKGIRIILDVDPI